MTAARGGAPDPTDSQGIEGTGPSTDESASTPPPYDMGARWHRYKGAPPTVGQDSTYWAAVSEALLYHPALTGRLRHRALVVDVWCALYITLMAGRQHGQAGEVDPCEIAASLNVSDRTVPDRALSTLEAIGAVFDRRRIGNGNTIWLRLDGDRFGVTRAARR